MIVSLFIDNILVALKEYKGLYEQWKAQVDQGKEPDNPSNDCLGIARIVFCAYYYPFCNKIGDNENICKFLCDIWLDRCSKQTELYNKICAKQRNFDCSFANLIQLLLAALIIFLFILNT